MCTRILYWTDIKIERRARRGGGWVIPPVRESRQVVRSRALVLQWSCVTNYKITHSPASMGRCGGENGLSVEDQRLFQLHFV